jgi:hypothetical protein
MKCPVHESPEVKEDFNTTTCPYYVLSPPEGCPSSGCRFSSSLSYDSETVVLSVAADSGVYENVTPDDQGSLPGISTDISGVSFI